MTSEQIEFYFSKYDLKNLKVIIIDNCRIFSIKSEDIEAGRVIFDNEVNCVEFKELSRGGIPTVVILPYDVIQSLVFDDPNPDDMLPTTTP